MTSGPLPIGGASLLRLRGDNLGKVARDREFVPMNLVGVRLEMPSNAPVVLLREVEGARYLPIWIGAVEAQAIVVALEKEEFPRPLTHDLLRLIVEGLGASVDRIVVTELREQVFYADLVLILGGRHIHVGSRPSDALALAARTAAPIYVAEAVLEHAAIEIAEDEDEDTVIQRFREALEDVTVEDFLDPPSQTG